MSDEDIITDVMATTGIDRAGAERALRQGKRLADALIEAHRPPSRQCPKCGHDPDAEVGDRWTLRLDKRLTSANLRTVNAGSARWRYGKERDAWQWLVKAERVNRRVTTATSKRRVTIERQYAGRCQEMDRDNLVAGAKPLVDALVREGVARDDRAEWLELHVTQRRMERNMTVVTVEELS